MEKKNHKYRILVCGTRFGKFYVEAVKRRENDMELLGILAKGSEKSKRYAKYLPTSLYTSVDQVPMNQLDLVCIAVKSSIMGGQGTELALEFLERGIPVILEQPVHAKDIVCCMKMAVKMNTYFLVGNLYKNLMSVRNYKTILKRLCKQDVPLYLEMKLATQVSYPASRLLNDITNCKICFDEFPMSIEKGFQILKGKSGELPMVLFADNRADPKNIDTHLPLFYQVSVGFNSGTLSLLEPFGSTVWIPAMCVEDETDGIQKLPFQNKENLSDLTTHFLTQNTPHAFCDVLEADWTEAVAFDLDNMCSFLKEQNQSRYHRYVKNEIQVAETWQKIMGCLKYPETKNNDDYVHINVESIKI